MKQQKEREEHKMKLQNLVRFVKSLWKGHQQYVKLKKRMSTLKRTEPYLIDPTNPFPYEYTYTVYIQPCGVLTAAVLKNGIKHCMYYADKGFMALADEMGNWVISKEEQELMLNDINSFGENIDGLTLLHEKPVPEPDMKFIDIFRDSYRYAKSI